MPKKNFPAVVLLAPVIFAGATCLAQTKAEKAPYPAMAPLDQYLMPDESSEIALARSAAPASISDAAEVMVLGRNGIHNRGEGEQWLSLSGGTIMGRRYR